MKKHCKYSNLQYHKVIHINFIVPGEPNCPRYSILSLIEEVIQEKPKTVLSHRAIDTMGLFQLDYTTPSDTREMLISILEMIPELGELFSIYYRQES